MLTRLSVENYALIDRLDISFAPDLNIITGETGAGKSILLGALGLILGNRADTSVVKDQTRNCVVEAEFDIGAYNLQPMFDELDIEYDDRPLFRRIITPAGKSRAYVNDFPVQLASLREIGERLIDIHSQHQTLMLADSAFQTGILDSVAAQDSLLYNYRENFQRLKKQRAELETLTKEAEERLRDREYLAFQLHELQDAKLQADEQQELEAEQTELAHASEIKEVLMWASQRLTGADDNLLAQLKEIESAIGRITTFYPHSEELHRRLHSNLLEIKDLTSEITSDADRIEADPQRLEAVEKRLGTIYTLLQKHKVASVEELLKIQSEYETKLADMDGAEERIAQLTSEIEVQQQKTVALASQITAIRKQTAPEVESQIEQTLSELGMPSAKLHIEIEPAEELSTDGADRIRFLFSANRNLALQPVERVASGGELSRLMLSLKAMVARHKHLPTVIFDEIDTGISGAIADKTGEIISELARHLQVINITHLPQIACKGENHFFVYKKESDQTTSTQIRKLSPDERIDEIAKMLSGSNISDAAKEQAKVLLSEATH